MIRFFLFCFLLPLFLYAAEKPVFRLHIFNEPSSLKPWDQKNSNAGYFLSQITSTLMSFQDDKLTGKLAQSCVYKKDTLLVCKLHPEAKWSNGRKIQASDFVRAFRSFLDPSKHAFRADLLFPIKNAKAVFTGKLPVEKLAVVANADDTLEISLESPDAEFIYTLASPLLYPLPSEELPDIENLRANPSLWLSSGPYKIERWQTQKRVRLTSNDFFVAKNSQRPQLEFLFIPEDSVAVGLYEKKQLDFLRRLPTLYIPRFKGRADYFEVKQIRLDYLGLNIADENLRKALAGSLNYADLQKLFSAHAPPGCPGIGHKYYDGDLCLSFHAQKAKEFLNNAKAPLKQLEFLYSKQGGDDHQRAMEWMQSEWKKNLGLKIDLRGLENKIFIQTLENKVPDIYRKGIALERPTCLAALENFESTSSENYLKFKSKKFDSILLEMRRSQDTQVKKRLCTEALKLLLDPVWIIPTGPIHFTLLIRPGWTGWKLNELNQLDLSDLRRGSAQ